MAFVKSVPLWLFLGPELGNKNDEIKQLKAVAKKKYGDLDEDTFYTYETSLATVLSLLQNGSLFSGGRFVVLKGAESLKKKEDIALLSEWVKGIEKKADNENSSHLVLVSDDFSVDKKLENIVPKSNKKVFWELFDNQKVDWVRKWFTSAGLAIEIDAIDAILERIENDTETLRGECARFPLCFDKGHCVSVDDVETVLNHSREETPFTLFESLCDMSKNSQERLTTAIGILQNIRNSKDSSSVQLIAALSSCYRKLMLYHILLEENPYPNDFDFKIKGFSSKKMQAQYAMASKTWTKKETVLCLSLLSNSDMSIRTTGSQVEDIVLQELLYSLIIKKGRELQVYTV